MCYNAREHKKLLKRVANLDTLEGSDNKRRRQLKKLHNKQRGKCYWCGDYTYLWWEISTEKFQKVGKHRIATIEHLTPISAGGLNTIENYACACRKCNTIRSSIPHGQFFWVTRTTDRYEKFMKKKSQAAQSRANKRREKSIKRFLRHYEKGLANSINHLEINVCLQVLTDAKNNKETARRQLRSSLSR